MTIRRGVELDTRVVSRRDFLTTQTQRESIQRRKLQTAVARYARNRRFAVEITRDERLHDVAFEVAFEIQHVKREAEFFGDAACVVNVIEGTAARRQRIAVFVDVDAAPLIPELHRKTDEFVTLLFQDCRGRG